MVPYVASMQGAGLAGAHWWCASDIYTEHGCPPEGKNYTWIPHEDFSGGGCDIADSSTPLLALMTHPLRC